MKPLRILSLLLLTGLMISCAKDTTPSGDLNGTYVGTYEETGTLQDYGTVKVVFVGSNFSGESQGTSRPICNGGYAITIDSIKFTNLCSTPDSELLLAGSYYLIKTGDSLYFSRGSNGVSSYKEIFSLKKQ